MQGLVEFLRSLGAARMAAMAAVTVALVAFFAFLILRVTAPQMTPLFTDLTFEDSAAVVKELDRQAVALRDRVRTFGVPDFPAAGRDEIELPLRAVRMIRARRGSRWDHLEFHIERMARQQIR